MQIIDTNISDLKVIEPKIFHDARGCFFESYHAERYQEHGIPTRFVQDNVSHSKHGVLRGLHFQQPQGQGKLVSVQWGEVYDVAVDVRQGSKTFGQWYGIILSHKNKRQLWIPSGFAHGFVVTSEEAIFTYKCDAYYNSKTEQTIRWDDPELRIPWPVQQPSLSPKDQAADFLKDMPLGNLPIYHT